MTPRSNIIAEHDEYWEKALVLSNLVKIKTHPVQTPYILRGSEEFFCILLPPREVMGIAAEMHQRVLRLDGPSTVIEEIPKHLIAAIDDIAIKAQQTQWAITGSKGDTYNVECKGDGKYTCTCAQFKFRKKECRHILQVKVS